MREARLDEFPVGDEIGRRRGRLVLTARLLVALRDLREQPDAGGVHLVALGHDDPRRLRAREVVEQRRAAVPVEDVAQRHDADLIGRRNRSLRRRIVGTQRLDRVADEFEPHRMGLAGREDVDDASADGELAVLVGRILAGEAGVDEQLGEIQRRDVLPGTQIERRGEQALRRRDARQQRGRRRHDDAGGPARDRVQRAGADRRHADVRLQAAIRVDFVRWKRQDRALGRRVGEALEGREEERDVGARLFELGIARHDVEHDAGRHRLRRGGDIQRLRRSREPRHDARRDIHPAARGGGLEHGPQVQRRRCGHAETSSVANGPRDV